MEVLVLKNFVSNGRAFGRGVWTLPDTWADRVQAWIADGKVIMAEAGGSEEGQIGQVPFYALKGDRGEKGDAGIGIPGMVGERGPAGLNGVNGSAGPVGPAGLSPQMRFQDGWVQWCLPGQPWQNLYQPELKKK